MNYYEHHIGDYDEATSHLTACEDGIYSRMIRKYYATERPLIADVPKLQRLVRASTPGERKAVVDVLEEFFHLEEDGWHQDTCDEIIAAFRDGEPEREVRRANEDNRVRRHREERAKLFKALTDAGQHAAWNIPTSDLRDRVQRLMEQPATAPETNAQPLPATAPVTPVTAPETNAQPLPATAPVTPATATQTPDTRHQIPVTKEIEAPVPGRTGDPPRLPGVETQSAAKQQRLSQVTKDAVEAYNKTPFTKRQGGNCPNVTMVNDVREKETRRCLPTASQICALRYGGPTIKPEFWTAYFESVDADPFHSGRTKPGSEHANWTPDFEFLTRPEVMTKIFDRAMSEVT